MDPGGQKTDGRITAGKNQCFARITRANPFHLVILVDTVMSQGPCQSPFRREEQGLTPYPGLPESTAAERGLPSPLGSLGGHLPETEEFFDRTIEGKGQGKGGGR
jgi:hypothetical protein